MSPEGIPEKGDRVVITAGPVNSIGELTHSLTSAPITDGAVIVVREDNGVLRCIAWHALTSIHVIPPSTYGHPAL